MKRGGFTRAIGLLIGMILLQAGACDPHGGGYTELSRSVETDPATGDTIVTVYWQRGSQTTATFKRIPKGNTDRRTDPLPPVASDD
jgi:hypothetical protein